MSKYGKICLVLIIVGLALMVLTSCGPERLIFEGKERPVHEIEDIISDRLEAENPGYDLDAGIYEETE